MHDHNECPRHALRVAKGAELIDEPHIDIVDEFGGGWGLWTIAELLQSEAQASTQPQVQSDLVTEPGADSDQRD